MDGFSFEPSAMPEADTIATAQTLQYVSFALSDDADSIISGSLGGHIPPLFSPLLPFFTIPVTENCEHSSEASPAKSGSEKMKLHNQVVPCA